MTGCGQESIPESREWSGVPPGGLGVVGSTSRRAGSGWEAHPVGMEVVPEGREWSGGAPGGLGVVRRPSWRAGSVREAHAKGREVHL